MLRFLNKFLCSVLVLALIQQAAAFSLLGPKEAWQNPTIGFYDNDIGGSRNLGDEYRINSKIVTYAFDPSFLDYFGPNGVKAVDQAIALLNKLPPASKATTNLVEFLTDDAGRINARAEALNLVDLKAATLSILLEHMGLSGERHIFDLRQRIPTPVGCVFNYTTVIRNYDPVTHALTRHVNGSRYTYSIFDTCPGPPGAEAVEELISDTDFYFTAVASYFDTPFFGKYFINLTRDDFGGLRYLYSRTNYNFESMPTNAFPLPLAGPWAPIDIFTNVLGTNTFAVRGGVEKVTYRKTNYDIPFSTQYRARVFPYKLPILTTGGAKSESIRRLVEAPDIIFRAADIAPPDPAAVGGVGLLNRQGNIYVDNPDPDNGPGVIIPQTVITFSKIGPFYLNFTPFFLDEATAIRGFSWGSFDGSTNDPIVYPNGTTVQDLEDLMFGQTGN